MKRKRFLLGPIKNPTWKDFAIRVGGTAVLMVAVILASRVLVPGHVGTVVIVVSALAVMFLAFQEWRQKKAWREERTK